MSMECPTPGELKRICRFYQKLLRLQDWNIEIRYCKPTELSNSIAAAENSFDLHHKESRIQIIHPDHGVGDVVDIERTVVHELVHLLVSPAIIRAVGSDKWMEISGSDAEETAITMIADALVKLRRAAA